jgi:hypothetical protein
MKHPAFEASGEEKVRDTSEDRHARNRMPTPV